MTFSNTVFPFISDDTFTDSTAIATSRREPLSYGALNTLIQQNVEFLNQYGFGRNDRIAVVMANGAEMATVCLSIMSCASCVPLNPDYMQPEFSQFLSRLNIKALITDKDETHAAIKAANKQSISIINVVSEQQQQAGLFSFGFLQKHENRSAPNSGYAQAGDTAIVLLTSGSTSTPKIVPLSHNNISASSVNMVRSLNLSENDVCLNMLPMFHIGALVDLLIAPLSVGSSVVCATSMTSSTFFSYLDEYRPTWYQGVPTMIKDVVDHANRTGLTVSDTSLRLIRSVSSPLSKELMQLCEQLFQIPVIEIYGMTETAGVITSNPLPPAVRKPGSVGIPCGTEIHIIDETGNPVDVELEGEIVVRGDNVTNGYEGDRSSKHDNFVNSWFRTGDQGYLDQDGYLFITGRVKELINRGGEKISPREVDGVLLQHPLIHDAASFPIPHESLGEEVAAVIVLETGADLSKQKLQDYMASELAYFKIPRAICFLDEIPKGPTGKLQRHTLSEICTNINRATHQHDIEVATTPLAIELVALWESVLNVSPIGIHDNFFELGGDSLKALTFIDQLEKNIGIHADVSALLDSQTVHEFENYIETHIKGGNKIISKNNIPGLSDIIFEQLKAVMSSWQGKRLTMESLIVGRNTLGLKTPLYWCVNADLEFSQLAKHIGLEQPVYGMRSLYKLKDRSHKQNLAIAKYYASEIIKIQPEGPYLIGGFCEGAKIAFDIAQQLIASHREIKLLCMQEYFVPQKYNGRVAFFLSGPGRISPYHRFQYPELGWSKFYSGDITVNKVNCEHSSFYEDANILVFANQLKNEIANAKENISTLIKPTNSELQVLGDDAYQAVIKRPALLLLQAGKSCTIKVEIRNTSPVSWQPTEGSGITLGNRWANLRGKIKIWTDGCKALSTEIPPGSVITTDIRITAPNKCGPWLLDIDLVDQGVCWFKDRGSKTGSTIVLVLNFSYWERFKKNIREFMYG
jgi:oxalate---CoA ligase